MSNKLILVLVLVNFLIGFACSSANEKTSNSANGANVTNIDPKNMPPGLSASPIQPSGNSTPGIPDMKSGNVNLPKGATPTPGIPDEETLKKQLSGKMPKGATPTPGIPDPETLKKQMNQPVNVNAPNPEAANSATSGVDRQRKVNKP